MVVVLGCHGEMDFSVVLNSLLSPGVERCDIISQDVVMAFSFTTKGHRMRIHAPAILSRVFCTVGCLLRLFGIFTVMKTVVNLVPDRQPAAAATSIVRCASPVRPYYCTVCSLSGLLFTEQQARSVHEKGRIKNPLYLKSPWLRIL